MSSGRRDRFRGVYPILYSLFDANQRLDRESMRFQVEACVAAGVHGMAILGIATEYYKLDLNERRDILEWAAEDLRSRLPLAVTIGEPSIHGQITMARAAEGVGADWLILQPPQFRGVSEGQLVRFLGAVAGACTVPVAIQNNLVNLDVHLSAAALSALHRNHPNITLLKCEGPVLAVKRLLEETGGVFDNFQGLGGRELTSSLRAGCVGCIPAPELCDVQARIFDLATSGDPAAEGEAESLHAKLLPALTYLHPNPPHFHCYGKRLFAMRAGLGEVIDREPFLPPSEFGLEELDRHRLRLPPWGAQVSTQVAAP